LRDVYLIAAPIAEERPILAIGRPTIADPVEDAEIAQVFPILRRENVVDLCLLEIAALKRLHGIRKVAKRRCRREFHSHMLRREDISTRSLEELCAALREEYESGVRLEDDIEIDGVAGHEAASIA
jgi:hypothetical protein